MSTGVVWRKQHAPALVSDKVPLAIGCQCTFAGVFKGILYTRPSNLGMLIKTTQVSQILRANTPVCLSKHRVHFDCAEDCQICFPLQEITTWA